MHDQMRFNMILLQTERTEQNGGEAVSDGHPLGPLVAVEGTVRLWTELAINRPLVVTKTGECLLNPIVIGVHAVGVLSAILLWNGTLIGIVAHTRASIVIRHVWRAVVVARARMTVAFVQFELRAWMRVICLLVMIVVRIAVGLLTAVLTMAAVAMLWAFSVVSFAAFVFGVGGGGEGKQAEGRERGGTEQGFEIHGSGFHGSVRKDLMEQVLELAAELAE